jgi:hypothetical protein
MTEDRIYKNITSIDMSHGYVGLVFDWLHISSKDMSLLVRATRVNSEHRANGANFDNEIVRDATAIVANDELFRGLMKEPGAVYLEPSQPTFNYSEIQISKAGLEAYIEKLKALQD